MKNADETEGHGPMVPDECFINRLDAENYIRTQFAGWEIKEITIHENMVEFRNEIQQRLRKSALDKLTAAEKLALGLIS